MPWLKIPHRDRPDPTMSTWLAETRTTRSTCAAMASQMATLALEVGRLEARLEAVLANGLPCSCATSAREEVTDRDRSG